MIALPGRCEEILRTAPGLAVGVYRDSYGVYQMSSSHVPRRTDGREVGNTNSSVNDIPEPLLRRTGRTGGGGPEDKNHD